MIFDLSDDVGWRVLIQDGGEILELICILPDQDVSDGIREEHKHEAVRGLEHFDQEEVGSKLPFSGERSDLVAHQLPKRVCRIMKNHCVFEFLWLAFRLVDVVDVGGVSFLAKQMVLGGSVNLEIFSFWVSYHSKQNLVKFV